MICEKRFLGGSTNRKLASSFSTIEWQALSVAFTKKELESIGGVSYLNEVFGFTPTSASWKHYYGLAFDAHRLKEAHLCALKILEIEDPRDAGQAAEAAEATLRSIGAPAIKESVPFKERIFQTFEWIETLATTPPESVMTIFEQNNFQLSSDEKTREIDARVQRLKLEDWDLPA